MNYATLVKTVKSYVENSFPETIGSSGLTSTEQIDTFIKQAEQRIYNAVQILALRKNTTLSTISSNQYLAVPSDWLSNFSVAVVNSGTHTFLLNRDVSYIREAFPVVATTGVPTHYAMFDDTQLLLAPTPDAIYSVEMHYFYYPTTIVTASTTWLGDNFDSVLLYGTLLEAYVFMKGEEDVIAAYKIQYDDALSMLAQLAEGKNRQDNYITKQVKVAVESMLGAQK